MRALLRLLLLLPLTACSGQPQNSGITEPLRVTYEGTNNAQFRAGSLPGSRPLTSPETLADVAQNPPTVSLNVSASVIRESDTGFVISGSTSSEALAVGIRFLDLGSGYWLLPVAGQDPTRPGTFSWSATLDFGAGIPAGFHSLLAVGIDSAGHGGTQTAQDLCVASDIPDNLSACSPGAKPPTTVLSMAWDTAVDLDLRVVTPLGKIVDPKHPSTALAVNGHVDPSVPGTGVFDTDAERDCVDTGHRRENLVWQDPPDAGRYYVYASLYSACGQPSVRFAVSLNQPGPAEDGGVHHLVSTFERTGELLASGADAGTSLGLFVTEFVVQP
ncbi:MAG TPA: hypothetical protein VIK01_20005 [Polyangiaceae bacterium]